jgi:hypothetical protein
MDRGIARGDVQAHVATGAAAVGEAQHDAGGRVHHDRRAAGHHQDSPLGMGHGGGAVTPLGPGEPGQVATGRAEQPQPAVVVDRARRHRFGQRLDAPFPVSGVARIGDRHPTLLLVHDVHGAAGGAGRHVAGGPVQHPDRWRRHEGAGVDAHDGTRVAVDGVAHGAVLGGDQRPGRGPDVDPGFHLTGVAVDQRHEAHRRAGPGAARPQVDLSGRRPSPARATEATPTHTTTAVAAAARRRADDLATPSAPALGHPSQPGEK